MRYRLTHTTLYAYSQPVLLLPHILRLRPRCYGDQALDFYQLQVDPTPAGITEVLDAEGNAVQRLWWSDTPTSQLRLQVTSQVLTYCTNPFNYLLETWATQLPMDYPASLLSSLHPYLQGTPGMGIDPLGVQLGQEVAQAVDHNPVMFLSELTQRIYRTCKHELRETGAPLPPSVTWAQQAGSCRDLTMLFLAACRAVGLAGRFVSGYQEGDPESRERHLHAWAEVYLPGAGWRGYDPTQGLAVSDRHIALVASSNPIHAAPVTGALRVAGARTSMTYDLTLQVLPEIEG